MGITGLTSPGGVGINNRQSLQIGAGSTVSRPVDSSVFSQYNKMPKSTATRSRPSDLDQQKGAEALAAFNKHNIHKKDTNNRVVPNTSAAVKGLVSEQSRKPSFGKEMPDAASNLKDIVEKGSVGPGLSKENSRLRRAQFQFLG